MNDVIANTIDSLAAFIAPFVDKRIIDLGLSEAKCDSEADGAETLLWAASDAAVVVPEELLTAVESDILPLADRDPQAETLQKYITQLRALSDENTEQAAITRLRPGISPERHVA